MVTKKIYLTLCILVLSVFAAWAGGIGSAKDLQAFIKAYNAGEDIAAWTGADTVVVLTSDIDLSKVKDLGQVEVFSGVFDGKGHSLKGWKSKGGLFALVAEDGVVRNLVIDAGCSAKLSPKGGEYRFGFIADTNEGMIIDCENRGKVSHKSSYATADVFVGGLVGFNRNVILRCTNHGKIVSDISAEAKPELNFCVGGIAGGVAGKTINCSTVARCVNYGDVTLLTDAANYFVGGIEGLSNSGTLKYCVNRGSVKADTRLTENGNASVGHIGGIVGQTKGDIFRCDNFGYVTGTGAGGADVGGIAGIPHANLVIAECVNYATVTAMGEHTSNVGGIAGNIGRPVHIRGCINNGKVSFEGLSPRTRSVAGGIVGNIYTPKSQNAAAYVRDCINHGVVNASPGGNKYGPNSSKCIHAGGIVGYASVREDLLSYVSDCSSDGKVVCPSGRAGNICGFVSSNVKIGGAAADVWARPAEVSADGSNVRGRVLDPSGKPLEGIKVTDGRRIVLTDADGAYSMKSDLEDSHFIYLCLPADGSVPTREGMPCFFRKVPRYCQAVEADFVLEKRPVSKEYTVLMIADPQVRPFGMDGSMEAWHESVAPDAEAFRASCTNDVYCINLGDLVYNYMGAWDDYIDGAALIKCPTFNVIGNHDYDQGNLFETDLGNVCYETYVGPEHYSFDLGDIHYVVLNTILYDRRNKEDKYHYGLDDRALEWLKEDLSFVPKDKVVMTCTHHNPFKTPYTSPRGSHNYYSEHYFDYRDLLKDYKAVYAWNGHNHQNFYYNYEGKQTEFGSPSIQCISVARCTGALRLNAYIASKGEPQGYMVVNVDGDKVDWYYKSVGRDKSYQMNVFPPDAEGAVIANIWNHFEGWSTPVWYENGVPVAEMTLFEGIDPGYQKIFDKVENKTTRRYCAPHETRLWKVTPSAGCTSGEVRVSDMFGNEYIQKINW